MSNNFANYILEQKGKKKSNILLGLRPDFSHLPTWLKNAKLSQFGKNWAAVSEAVISFDNCVIEATAPYIIGIMPRLSYYQQYGAYGLRALERTIINALNQELVVIIDTGLATYDPHLSLPGETFVGNVPSWEGARPSNLHVHAMTIIPYYGAEMVEKYVQLCKQTSRGLFILASNQFNGSQWVDLAQSLVGTNMVSSLGVVFDERSTQHLNCIENTPLSAILRIKDEQQLTGSWNGMTNKAKMKTCICIEDAIFSCYSPEVLTTSIEDEETVRSRFLGCAESANKYRKKYLID